MNEVERDAARWRFVRLRMWHTELEDMIDDYPADCVFRADIEADAKQNDDIIDAAMSGGTGE